MKKISGIKIIKRGELKERKQTTENIFVRQSSGGQKNQHSVAVRVKDWVRDFKAKKQNEAAVARRFLTESRLAANQL